MVDFQTNQIDNEDKPLKGLQDKGIVNFGCEDCGKPLLVLQLTSTLENSESNVLTNVAVRCKDCGGFSYAQQILGHFHPGAPSDNMAFDIASDTKGSPDHDVLFEAWSK